MPIEILDSQSNMGAARREEAIPVPADSLSTNAAEEGPSEIPAETSQMINNESAEIQPQLHQGLFYDLV